MGHFRRLQLYGFKSFADKTRLEFGPGVTAIVGPNGSGKSNVADAVRWVLGEQNARVLRGRTMPDLVFAGSEGRRSLSMAEVTIIFDNSDRSFDLDFSEVSITRRLYKSGESEYELNRQMCRWRDINEMLLDSGIGRQGLTVVDQRRLEMILAAEGNERRILLEDVAGVGKYRTRKRAAMRKLEETQQKVERLHDIIGEVKERIEPLREQADIARKFNQFQTLRSEIKRLLLYVTRHQLVREQTREQERIAKFTNDIDAVRAELIELNQEKQSVICQLADYETRAAQTGKQLDEVTSNWREYRERAAADEAAIGEMKSSVQRSEAELIRLGEQMAELEAAAAREVKVDGDVDQLSDRLQQLRSDKAKVEEQRSRVSRQMNSMSQQRSALSEDLAGLKAKLTALLERKAKVSGNQSGLDERMSAIESKMKRLVDRRDQLKQQIASCDNDRDLLKARRDEIRGRLDELREKREQLQSLVSALTAERQTRIEALGSDEDDKLPGSVVGEFIDVPSEWVMAVDAAIGGMIESLIADGSDVDRLIGDLGKRGLRRRIVVMRGSGTSRSDRPSLGDVITCSSGVEGDTIKRLLSQFVICDSISDAIEQAGSVSGGAVLKDGTVVLATGVVIGGSAPRTGKVQRLRVQQVSDQLDKVSSQLKRVKVDTDRLQSEFDSTSSRLDRAKSDGQGLRSELTRVSDQIELCKSEKEQVSDQGRQLDDDSKEITEQIAGVSSNIERVNDQLLAIKSDLDQHRNQLGKYAAEQREIDKNISSCSEQISEVRVKIARQMERAEADQSRYEQTKKRQQQLTDELKQLTSDLKMRQTRAKEHRQECDRLEVEVNELRHQVGQLSDSLSKLRAQQSEQAKTEDQLRRRVAGLEGQMRRSEMQMARLDAKWEQIADKLDELAGFTPDVDVDEIDGESLNEQLAETDRDIEQLGPVNPLAVREYEQVSERYEFLTGQRDDLVSGAQSLENALGRLDKEMRQQFSETLDEVDTAYHEVFRDVFGGGKAQVVLTDDDPLTAPVELQVQVPGKKMTNLSLLSGGERALCAIAFLFAILRVRPAPFCLLDEVDAALDEVNTVRFASFLRRYSANTQFIAITHQKQTMEAAGAIYGVTMSNSNASRVLSLNLAEAGGDS